MNIFDHKLSKKSYNDLEVVIGLQSKDSKVEKWFYHNAKRYFMAKFQEIFFDQDQREEIFQDSFLRLWMQIDNARIIVIDGVVNRIRRDGEYAPLTCSLNTFLMAIAKNEYRELIRNSKDLYVEDYFEKEGNSVIPIYYNEENQEEYKNQVIDECIQKLSPRCIEILTLFYLEGKSLDEILLARDKNTSKVGLKTAKYKCMNSLRDKIKEQFTKLDITI